MSYSYDASSFETYYIQTIAGQSRLNLLDPPAGGGNILLSQNTNNPNGLHYNTNFNVNTQNFTYNVANQPQIVQNNVQVLQVQNGAKIIPSANYNGGALFTGVDLGYQVTPG